MPGLADHPVGVEDDLLVSGLAVLEAPVTTELVAEDRVG